MKSLGLSLFIIFILNGCASSFGIGLCGVTGVGGNGIAASEVHLDSSGEVHGSVAIGTDIRL